MAEDGFFAGWVGLPPGLVAAEVEDVVSGAALEGAAEPSDADWLDCGVCAAGEPAAEPAAEGSAGMEVDDGEVAAPPAVDGVVDDGLVAEASACRDCCGGKEVLPAPAWIFKRRGR